MRWSSVNHYQFCDESKTDEDIFQNILIYHHTDISFSSLNTRTLPSAIYLLENKHKHVVINGWLHLKLVSAVGHLELNLSKWTIPPVAILLYPVLKVKFTFKINIFPYFWPNVSVHHSLSRGISHNCTFIYGGGVTKMYSISHLFELANQRLRRKTNTFLISGA